MLAAQQIRSKLSLAGISESIEPADHFNKEMASKEVTEIIVLGGLDAYEGVGSISSSFLNQEDQRYLRSVKGASLVRKFTKSSRGMEKEVIVIAGNIGRRPSSLRRFGQRVSRFQPSQAIGCHSGAGTRREADLPHSVRQ